MTYDLAGFPERSEATLQQRVAGNTEALVIVDRLTVGSAEADRVRESLETAFQFGGGCVALVQQDEDDVTPGALTIDDRHWELKRFSKNLICDQCETVYPDPEPNLFSYNNALGACPECEGFGSVQRFDIDLIVPDASKSLRKGAIAPWNTPSYRHELDELLDLADDYGVPVDVPFGHLSKSEHRTDLGGSSRAQFWWFKRFFCLA